MNDIDRVLGEAGDRWRASQPAPMQLDQTAAARVFGAPRRSWPASMVGAATVLLVLLTVLATRPLWGGLPEAGPPASADLASCPVTRPEPPFVPPAPHAPAPPADYKARWFGSAGLWTMLGVDGEVWPASALPRGPAGLSQKTFWWSTFWSPAEESEPAIAVTGRRLDGPGRLRAGSPTNASADFGTAMLVGVEFPGPGCWQLTARYRQADVSYVVLITDD